MSRNPPVTIARAGVYTGFDRSKISEFKGLQRMLPGGKAGLLKTCDLGTFEVKTEGESVKVEI